MPLSSKRPIRIAGASGSASDRRHALAAFVSAHHSDPVDVIVGDFLSEANMTTSAGRRIQNSNTNSSRLQQDNKRNAAFEVSVLEALQPVLDDLALRETKVIVNAGASDTKSLYEALGSVISQKGLSIEVAWISGDEVLPQILQDVKSGTSTFRNIYTAQPLSDWEHEPIFAQAYLGAMGIVEALSHGAQIVLCGRVADASLVVGAAMWWHGWRRDAFALLANALVAGHLVECSTYVTGGNFSGFKSLMSSQHGWKDIGFPIAEISSQGQVVITKQRDSGGMVSVKTCSSQLLYEIQGYLYFNSDVTAVLEKARFTQVGKDRVLLQGIEGLPPPPTTKVGLSAFGGVQAEAWYLLTGLDIKEKAAMLEDQVRHALAPHLSRFTMLKFSILGSVLPNADNQDAATVILRIFAQARKAEDLAPSKFLKPVVDNIMQAYPGATFHLDLRAGHPKQFLEFFVTSISQARIDHAVHFESKQLSIPAPVVTQAYPRQQFHQDTTAAAIDLAFFGPTQKLPLGTIVRARSGDKGSDCNCGFWVDTEQEYVWLKNLLSVSKIIELLGTEYDKRRRPKIGIERCEFSNLYAVHFLFRNLLDRGVSSTSSVDFLGKNCAEFLRNRHVDIPVVFVAQSKL